MRTLYIVALAAVAAIAADDPGGWSKARWGMTDDEIVKAFDGQVTRFSAVDPYQHARVGIESLDIAGAKFKVYMSPGPDGKLDHVLFTPISASDQTDQTFQSVENLLVQKYGRPWKSDEDQTELQWSFPTTTIHLSRMKFPGSDMRLINLIYRQRRPEANPL
jgi:hypothetical protein